MSDSQRRLRPDSLELLTDAFTVAFGGWTIISTLTVIFGGTPRGALSFGTALLLAVLAALGVAIWKRARWIEPYMSDAADGERLALARLGWWQRALLLVAVAVPVVLWLKLRSPWAEWYTVVAVSVLFAIIAALHRPTPANEAAQPVAPTPAPTADPRWLPWVVHGLAFGCALFTLAAFRPRTDDAFYVNMAVTIADYPDLALFSRDMIHGPETPYLAWQEMFPPYRVHSFESLAGQISYWTGIEAMAVLHFGLATFFGWLTPIAIGRALRLLAPRAWLLGLIATLSYYMIEGSASRGFSNQAFVRLFNGKSALLTVGVPLLIVYGVRFAQKPSGPRFALLALAQIAGMGLSSTGIWLSPTVAGLAAFAAVPSVRKALIALPLTVLSSAYVLGVGLWVRALMGAPAIGSAVTKGVPGKGSGPDAGLGLLGWVAEPMLGHETTILATLALFGFAAAVAESAVVLRLFAAIGVFLFAVLANPWIAKQVAATITGKLTYERIFWLAPIPLGLGIACSALYALLRRWLPRVPAGALALAAVAGFLQVATETPVISRENMARIEWPPILKEWPNALKTARAICARTEKGTAVLVPKTIAHSIAMLHDCGYPLIAEMRWMKAPLKEERRRNNMEATISTAAPGETHLIAMGVGLDQYRIALVATGRAAWRERRTRAMLRRQGFERTEWVSAYQLWQREKPERVQRDQRVAQAVCARVADKSEVVLAPFGVSHAIAGAGCAVAPLGDRGELGSDQASLDLFDFESMLSEKYDFAPEQPAWVEALLASRNAMMVVLDHEGIRNRELKDLLARLGYVKQLALDGFHVYRKQPLPEGATPAAVPAPGPAPAVNVPDEPAEF
ncbi:MAG TPA: DUF6077 domain-containing protein [Polyangiales bacterium]|nr:DUF6077 domain-containing protein [Polyangiales bacterium]